MLGHVFPVASADDLRNGLPCNTMLPGQGSHALPGSVRRTYGANGGFSQASRSTSFSPSDTFRVCTRTVPFSTGKAFRVYSATIAPFAGAILHVVVLGPQKEMDRIDASGYVAVVAHEHSGRDRPICQDPSDAMGKMEPASYTELSVAVTGHGPSPQPAIGRLFHMLPKAAFKWLLRMPRTQGTAPATTWSMVGLQLPTGTRESLSANGASERDTAGRGRIRLHGSYSCCACPGLFAQRQGVLLIQYNSC
jgi:hypothetical protein